MGLGRVVGQQGGAEGEDLVQVRHRLAAVTGADLAPPDEGVVPMAGFLGVLNQRSEQRSVSGQRVVGVGGVPDGQEVHRAKPVVSVIPNMRAADPMSHPDTS